MTGSRLRLCSRGYRCRGVEIGHGAALIAFGGGGSNLRLPLPRFKPRARAPAASRSGPGAGRHRQEGLDDVPELRAVEAERKGVRGAGQNRELAVRIRQLLIKLQKVV